MGTYTTEIQIKGVDISVDKENQTVTVTGKAASITFFKNALISFKGLDINFMIDEVYPNGVNMISSETSILSFYSWRKLFRPGSIWLDVVQTTGWVEVK